MNIEEELNKTRQYIGDGVYVRFDGYNIHIAVNDHNNEVVVMEPDVIKRFIEYTERINKLKLAQ